MKKILFFILTFLILAITSYGKQWILFCSQGGVPGHAFAAFIKEDPLSGKPVEIGSWGFNPKIHSYPLTTVEGNIESENNTYRSDTFLAEVDQAEWEICRGVLKKWNVEKYNFTSNNCIDFVRELAKQIKTLVWPPYSLNSPFVFITQLKAHNSVWESYSLLSYNFSLNKLTSGASSDDGDSNFAGGVTQNELGKRVLQALKTNDKNLWISCLHPTETSFRTVSELRFKEFRDLLQKKGVADWSLVSFKGVKHGRWTMDSMDRVATRVRGDFSGLTIPDFIIEFTYKGKESNGRIGPMTIQEYKEGIYFIVFPGKKEDATLTTSIINGFIGGATPDELGQIIFKALQTNNKKLYATCIHPQPYNDDRAYIEKGFDRLREYFEEQGLTQWNLAKYSRVTFSKKTSFGTDDGGVTESGEQVRRNFTIEFSYKNQEFVGSIEGGVIITFNKKYLIWNGGFGSHFGRF